MHLSHTDKKKKKYKQNIKIGAYKSDPCDSNWVILGL
jgi:hypothetical protein